MSPVNGMSNSGIYPNYVYKNNQVSSQSLNKINAIPSDSTQGGTKGQVSNYSPSLNQNPLRPGQSQNYNATVASQMASSGRAASRMMGNQAPAVVSARLRTQGGAQNGTPNVSMQSNADPAQDPNKNIAQITSELNKKNAPNADPMKVETPAEKAQKALTEPAKAPAQKTAQERIDEMNSKANQTQSGNPAQDPNKNITQVTSEMNKMAAPDSSNTNNNMSNPAVMSASIQQASNNQSAIPNVSMS